jgi:hypothetical protein
MSDTPIPADVVGRAREIGAQLDDIHFNSRGSWLDDAVTIVARAIMEERERATSIIMSLPEKYGMTPAGFTLCCQIVAAIRQDEGRGSEMTDLEGTEAAN